MKTYRLLIVIFILLIIITAGELVYYFFSRQSKKIQEISTPKQLPIVNNIEGYLNSLDPEVKNDTIKSLLMNIAFDTTILKAEKISRSVEPKDSNIMQKVIATLYVKDKNNGQLEYHFSQTELEKLDIHTVDADEKKIPVKFEDLKEDDKISFDITLDLLRHPDNNLVRGEISVH